MSNTRLKAILVAIVLTVNATMAQSVGLLRDPDIEHGLQKLANPILRAAGLNIGAVKVFIVNDMSLNAFVIDHNHIFIHAGLVLKLQNADQLQSVIAHEAAHIANGHIAAARGQYETRQTDRKFWSFGRSRRNRRGSIAGSCRNCFGRHWFGKSGFAGPFPG